MAIIAFLGTGNMGRGMAARLLGAGHRVSVYNRSREKALPLVEIGARLAETPRAAAEGAEAVFAMVGDDEASRAVWTGPRGALAADLPPGALAIECSTLSHDWVLALAGEARAKGLHYVDAPVTGLPDAAAAGTLTLLVGAAANDLEAARPYLEPLAEEIIHFGPVGAGTAYKLIINLMGAVQIAACAEALALAGKAGLDLAAVAEAIAKGQGASPQVVRNSRRMVKGDHDRNVVFSGIWRLKDTRYGLALAAKLGQKVALGEAASAAYQELVDAGLGEQNESKVADVVKD